MLKLTPARTEPLWIDFLPGARLSIAPFGPADIMASRAAAGEVYQRDRESEEKDPAVAITATIALTTAFAHRVITAWTGIGNAEGEEIAVSPEAVEQLLALPAAYDAFDQLVMVPALNGLPLGAAA